MNITLKPEQEQFLREKLDSGKYGTIDEVIAEAFRLLEERDKYGRERSPHTAEEEKEPEFSFEIVTVNSSGEITNRRQGSARQKIEKLPQNVTLEMVYIPGGTFTMGSEEHEANRETNESPQHQVRVLPFYLGKYPVTQTQYQVIMGNNPSNFQGDKRPVESVTWYDAVEFCQKLSQKTGKTYRLPSEAEWEYACRAGTTTPFHFGETLTPELANYDGNYPYSSGPKGVYRKQTTDAGSFLPNAFGLYDMHGNVYEWCQDVWHENYNGAPTDGSAWETGGDSDRRLQRGGSWNFNPRYCRSANRVGDVAGFWRHHRFPRGPVAWFVVSFLLAVRTLLSPLPFSPLPLFPSGVPYGARFFFRSRRCG